jgi:hypothetical protein
VAPLHEDVAPLHVSVQAAKDLARPHARIVAPGM